MEKLTIRGNKCENCGSSLQEAVNGSITCHYCCSIYNVETISDTEQHTAKVNNFARRDSTRVASPADYTFLIPSRADVFKDYIKRGAIIWFGYGLIRAVIGTPYPNFQVDSIYYNNILVSPIGETYWFLRAALFILVVPGVISSIFYNHITAIYRKR